MIYEDAILLSGVIYYGLVRRGMSLANRARNSLIYKTKGISKYVWHRLSYHLPFADNLRQRKIRKLLASGEYEPAVTDIIKSMKGKVFVDVGANVGYYSVLLSKNFESVYAFEPYPETFKKLCKHTAEFNVVNVVPLMKAVSDSDGHETLGLYDYNIQDFDPTTHIQLGPCMPNWSSYKQVKVETVSLASYFGDKEIDLIKVDVEGNEWKVLTGSTTIMKNIKSWIIELHDTERVKEMETFLKSQGYSIKWLDIHHVYAERKD
jgi:FkbM family methyltransferase